VKLVEKRISLNGVPAPSLFKPKLFLPIQPWNLGALWFLAPRWSNEPTPRLQKSRRAYLRDFLCHAGSQSNSLMWSDTTKCGGQIPKNNQSRVFCYFVFLRGTPGQPITPSSLQSKRLPVHRDTLKGVWGDKIQNYAGVIPQQTSPDWSSDINQSYMPLLEIEFFEIRFWDLPKPIQYCMYFLTPAPRSCSNLSSPPVAALPLVKSVLTGLKTDPEKIIFICLTWESSYLLTSSGQMGHGRLYHQIRNKVLQSFLPN